MKAVPGHEAEASGDAPPITSIHCRLPTLRIGEGTHQRVQPKRPGHPLFDLVFQICERPLLILYPSTQ